jgi:hypothetical protein
MARDRLVLGEYDEGAERGRSGCGGARMQRYMWDGALGRSVDLALLGVHRLGFDLRSYVALLER